MMQEEYKTFSFIIEAFAEIRREESWKKVMLGKTSLDGSKSSALGTKRLNML